MEFKIMTEDYGHTNHYTLLTDNVHEYDGGIGDATHVLYENAKMYGREVFYKHRVKKHANMDVWLLHCLTAPAFDCIDYVQFYVNGVQMSIMDMPISDEEKVVLTLKYGEKYYGVIFDDVRGSYFK